MSQDLRQQNINSSFFDGYYKEIWRRIFPEKTTEAEADFIIDECGVVSDNSVLDLLSGYGRHSLALARKGIQVTAIDNLPEYINELVEKAGAEGLKVEGICSDIFEAALMRDFDAAICMGNSFQFFNRTECLELLKMINNHLRPGGKLIINSWSIAEIAIRHFRDKSWGRVDDLLFLTENRFLFDPTRIETDSIIITDSGEREVKKGVDYIYSLAELKTMFEETGFRFNSVYSIPGKKIFALGDHRAYLVVEKSTF